MDSLRQLWSRLAGLLRRRHLEAETAEEMRQHLERRTQEKIAEGVAPAEARFAAQREFGGIAQLQEQCRDERRYAWLEQSAQDLRYAFRQVRRNPGFAATAIATLALGIGLNTAIFSVAYGALWRPLPFPDPDRLVVIASAQQTADGPRTFMTWAPGSYEAMRPRVTALDDLAAYSPVNVPLTGRGEPLTLTALEVSPNFLSTLGVNPARGRAFRSGAEAVDDDRSALISDRLWRTSLNADPAVVGQSITIDGVPRTVVGVLPRDFSFKPVIRGPGARREADILLSSRWAGDAGTDASLFLLGRLRAGVTEERAVAELTALANEPSIAAPAARGEMEDARVPGVPTVVRTIPLARYGVESVRPLLLVLLGAVSFVLLIACVNVANLQMARLSARRGELSVRLALGAGRGRIVRQLLTEAVVLSLAGAALGVLLARVAIDAVLPLVPPSVLPGLGGIAIDARVLAFCVGLSLVSTLLTGLLPALRISGAAAGGGERLRTLLVAAQVALTLVLLVGAGLLIHSFVRLTAVSTGFESGGRDGVVQTVQVTLPPRLYEEPERIHAFARGVLDRVQGLPGVKSASLVNSAPFGGMFIRDEFEIEGQPKPALDAGQPKIDADYFQTMGIPLLAGREFTRRDTAEALKVAIVSERLAREYFPGGPGAALGQRVHLGEHDEWRSVVGVVADIRQHGLDEEIQPMIYVPFQQERGFVIRFVSFVARTTTPGSVLEGIRAEIRRVAPDLPIEGTVTMDEAVAASVGAPRFRMWLLVLFAASATLIATCGIYGLMAYAVTQRRREIGVRMALGAEPGDVLRLVLARATRIIIAGLVVGLAGAAAVTRVLQRFLFEVAPLDPVVFTVVTLVLMAAGLLAAWLPARRAANVDPMVALRRD